MNNQITIIDNQNQTINVDLICYFLNNKNNKKYLFYTKNEVVQDGLIKMYVAEDSSVLNEITPEEWSNLKLIMQDIIKGSNNGNITFNPVNTTIKLGGEKVIALNQSNIDILKNNYKNDPKVSTPQVPISNKDLLSQSFGGSQQLVENGLKTPQQTISLNTNNPVDLEASAANLNMMPQVDVPIFDGGNDLMNENQSVPSMETSVQENSNVVENVVSSIEPISFDFATQNVPSQDTSIPNGVGITQENINDPLNINFQVPVEENVIPATNPGDNDFKVSSAPNIFDLPPVDTNINNVVENNSSIPTMENSIENSVPEAIDSSIPSNDLFNPVTSTPIIPTVNELKEENEISNSELYETEISDDLLDAQIAIAESNYKLYTSLAENNKKMVEVLKRQKKTKTNEDDLEKTASDLFKSNGALDEGKVLGLGNVA